MKPAQSALEIPSGMLPSFRCFNSIHVSLMKTYLPQPKKTPPALFEGEIKCFINSKIVETANQEQNIQV